MPIKRFSKKERKFVTVTQPYIFNAYNKYMGGVDLADNGIANYRIAIRGKNGIGRYLQT